MESELSAHEGKVPMKELERQVAQLTGEVQNLSGRLDALKNSNVKLISKDEKKKVHYLFIYIYMIKTKTKIHYKKLTNERFKWKTKNTPNNGAS